MLTFAGGYYFCILLSTINKFYILCIYTLKDVSRQNNQTSEHASTKAPKAREHASAGAPKAC